MPYEQTVEDKPTAKRGNRKERFTDAFIRNLAPNGDRQTYTDEACRGLAMRVGASGTKTWAFMSRDCHGKSRTETLGRYPDVGLKAARQEADKLRAVFASPEKLAAHLESSEDGESITLLQLLLEAEKRFAPTKTTWRQRGKKSEVSLARQVISTVFGSMLNRPATELTAAKAAMLVSAYQPISAERTGKTKANGQASRALAYLRTVFNWASHRTPKFQKIGAGRAPKLLLPELSVVQDPSTDDPDILGERDRVLSVAELRAVLPLLKVGETSVRTWWAVDLRPVAHRFILLTLSRREEVEAARWGDVDFEEQTWTKRVKGDFWVTHPLSQAAMALLQSLPGYRHSRNKDLIFPNQDRGPLGNWNRSTLKLQELSDTDGWHRHDLRRTGATILSLLGVAPQVVDTLLSHQNPMSKVAVSPALQSYVRLAKEMKGLPNPLRDAVETLAAAIAAIETDEL